MDKTAQNAANRTTIKPVFFERKGKPKKTTARCTKQPPRGETMTAAQNKLLLRFETERDGGRATTTEGEQPRQ